MQTNYVVLLRKGNYEVKRSELSSAINLTFIGDMAGEKPTIQMNDFPASLSFPNTFINVQFLMDDSAMLVKLMRPDFCVTFLSCFFKSHFPCRNQSENGFFEEVIEYNKNKTKSL